MIKYVTEKERQRRIVHLEEATGRYRSALQAWHEARAVSEKAQTEYEDARTHLELAKTSVINAISGEEIDE